MTVDELFQTPYWVIDILPRQVPRDSPGQYFAIEQYYLEGERLADIKRRHINVVLKVNCYRDISLGEELPENPSPAYVAEAMHSQQLCILVGESMILSEPDDTHLTLFNPDDELLELVKLIAAGEGLFVWRP